MGWRIIAARQTLPAPGAAGDSCEDSRCRPSIPLLSSGGFVPASTTETIAIRGLRYNIRHWGPAGAPPVFLLHGWMDASATFQFVVDALQREWHLIAPDWRGYGDSQWLGHPYWFPDYYADLEALLQHYSPDRPAQIVGHSMGANIAATFAALRPQRVARLAMLDFLGLKPDPAIDAAQQLGKWLDEISDQPRLRTYPDHAALARRLRFANPRLTVERAEFLSRTVSRTLPDGQVEMACDPWHKVAAPNLYRVEDAMAAWRRITAPVLMLIAERGFVNMRFG
ncbi:MAG: alpha/beta hydrolase, partial [Azonexus sp.]|nr:alpha/beta hydrolase [Azonexus sp.]